MRIVILPPLYLPPVQYFRAMAYADLAVIDTSMRYDKRAKAVHRTVLDGAHGPVLLTVPVTVPGTTHCSWDRVTVSPHAEWYRTQRATLDTLFGPTPFYDLMRHDLLRHIDASAVGRPITDLDIDLILEIRRLTNITTPLSVTLDTRHITPGADCADCMADQITDLRRHNWYPTPDTRSILPTIFNTVP